MQRVALNQTLSNYQNTKIRYLSSDRAMNLGSGLSYQGRGFGCLGVSYTTRREVLLHIGNDAGRVWAGENGHIYCMQRVAMNQKLSNYYGPVWLPENQ
jgi:hypothetical protein